MTEKAYDEASRLAADCRAALYCPQGGFYPDKSYGSRLRAAENQGLPALFAFAGLALLPFAGVAVQAVQLQGQALTVQLQIGTEERTVTLPLG